ncbi:MULTISPECIES: nuclear transport factor 2 family protein [unclassified Saccharothrix]|uniref:nuclear transport factor 2 family protein n=1 Tax=unclassified Saccharothrix TaxID=2593673 RepID=UPI00307E658A
MDVVVGRGEQLARAFVTAVESGDPVRWAEVFTDDATYALPDLPEPLRGRNAIEAMAATFFRAFPDMVFEIRTVVEQGDVVVLEGATKGTFTGPMTTPGGEVPPTGKSFETPFAVVCELSGTGLVAACREYYDTAAFAAQLGVTG